MRFSILMVSLTFICASFPLSHADAARPQSRIAKPQAPAGSDAESLYLNRDLGGLKSNIERVTGYYRDTLQKIFNEPNTTRSNASALRNYYGYSAFYTPFSDKVIDGLTRYAYIVDTSDDTDAVREAQTKYRQLLYKHMGNFNVVSHALDMSSLDPRFGNEVVLRKLYDAYKDILQESIKVGRGYEPDNAFKIITYGEENFLLEEIGGIVEKSEIYKVSYNKYYNVHNLSKENGDFHQIFIDVSMPIVQVQHLNFLRGKSADVNIPNQ